jgi:hypothetical protein
MKRTHWIDALLVFGLALAYLRLQPDCFSVFDEGLLVDPAERVYRGEMLHRDMKPYWNPGGFWLGAALFHVGGVNVATLRISLALFGAVAAVGVWRIARDHCGRVLAILAGLATSLVCLPIWWMASPHWYSTFTAIAAAVAFRSCFGDRPTPLALVATGVLCGVTFVMLQPVGAFLSAAVGVALVWDRAWVASRAAVLKDAALLAIGALVPVAAMYGYFAAHGLLGAMLYDTILYNLYQYGPSYSVSYGGVGLAPLQDLLPRITRLVLMILPPASYLLALAVVGSRYVRRTARLDDRRLLALVAVGVGLLTSNYYHLDLIHLAFAAPPAFAVAAALFARGSAIRGGRLLAHAGALALSAVVVIAGIGSLREQRLFCDAEISTPRGKIATSAIFVDQFQALFAFFGERVARGEQFYVYPYGPGYNFLIGQPNPTPMGSVFPNVPGLTTDAQFESVAAALEKKQVRYVMMSGILFGYDWLERYDTPLERYIRSHYRLVAELPMARILERVPPPSGSIPADPQVR